MHGGLLFTTTYPMMQVHVASPPFSDFGFENELNRLYFVCTRLYTYFFVCTPLTFLPLPGGGLGTSCYLPFSDFGFENGLNHLYFVCTRLYMYFFI